VEFNFRQRFVLKMWTEEGDQPDGEIAALNAHIAKRQTRLQNIYASQPWRISFELLLRSLADVLLQLTTEQSRQIVLPHSPYFQLPPKRRAKRQDQ
jgi:hypothetical protein